MLFKKKQKIFCIGRNKTGTTSLEIALKEFGFKMGDQAEAEFFLTSYSNNNFEPIIKFCKKAEAFQDVPFSWPNTWRVLHKHFPNAKFILTLRDADSWYKSITTFHSKMFADGVRIPNKLDLQNAKYRYKGFLWEVNRVVWKTPENDVYNREIFIKNYNNHNREVIDYFENNSNFLSIDVSKEDSYIQLSNFLNKKPQHKVFPHVNKTNSI